MPLHQSLAGLWDWLLALQNLSDMFKLSMRELGLPL